VVDPADPTQTGLECADKEIALARAKVALERTVVKVLPDGGMAHLAMSKGCPVSTLILCLAIVIIPDCPKGAVMQMMARFPQGAMDNLHDVIPAKIVCDAD